ncbi:MAG TPA: hypothetical protein VI895_01560 [Bdellovibrionota bacterium]|nr:hypothetical protein [Bdellovibrionota bacterium]
MLASRRRRLGCTLLLFGAYVYCDAAIAEDSNIFGSISTRYKLRATADTSDQDLETLLSLNMGEPLNDRVAVSLQAGGIFDLDGDSSDSTFNGVYDSFNTGAAGRIYHAYLDANNLGVFDRLRAGRQFRQEFESLYFDGLSLQWREAKGFKLMSYGGVPVHFYETETGSDSGDFVAGGAFEIDPVKVVRARFDYVHLKDDFTGFRANVGDIEDDLFGLSVWWDAQPGLMISSRFTSFLDQVRDLALDTRYRFIEQNLSLQFHFFSLLESYGVRVIDLDPYSFAGEYKPYYEMAFTGMKGIGEHFALDAGYAFRILIEEQVASAFNHGFQRFFLTGSTIEWPLDGMSLSLTGDYYLGQDNELQNDTYGTSFSIAQDLLKRKLRLTAGTAFYLYRYNLLAGNESDNVQTYYARGTVKFLKDFEGRLGYEFETSDLDNFHTLDVRVAWNF